MKKLKKKEKKMLIALGVVAVIGAISLFSIYGPEDTEPEVISESVEVIAEEKKESKSYTNSGGGGGKRGGGSGGTKAPTVSMDEFQKHVTSKDCWVLIEGDVYNVAGFIDAYPAQGEGVSEYCGTVGFEAGFLEENKIRDTIKDTSQRIGQIG